MRITTLVVLALSNLTVNATAQWSVETLQDAQTARKYTRATLSEFGFRAMLVVRCIDRNAEAVIHLREPVQGTHVQVIYRFDHNQAEARMATVSKDGHVLEIWNEEEKQQFAHASRLRVQLRPFVVFDFDLRGAEAVVSTVTC